MMNLGQTFRRVLQEAEVAVEQNSIEESHQEEKRTSCCGCGCCEKILLLHPHRVIRHIQQMWQSHLQGFPTHGWSGQTFWRRGTGDLASSLPTWMNWLSWSLLLRISSLCSSARAIWNFNVEALITPELTTCKCWHYAYHLQWSWPMFSCNSHIWMHVCVEGASLAIQVLGLPFFFSLHKFFTAPDFPISGKGKTRTQFQTKIRAWWLHLLHRCWKFSFLLPQHLLGLPHFGDNKTATPTTGPNCFAAIFLQIKVSKNPQITQTPIILLKP